MGVYVDWPMHYGAQSGFFKGKKSCHMYADTLEELLEMATKIGMRHSWLQDDGQSAVHFDLVESRRAAAIANGALELTKREHIIYFIDQSRKQRGQKPMGDREDRDKPRHLAMRCPECNERHIDKGEWATRRHKTHLCEYCGHEWKPTKFCTWGVEPV